MMGCAFEFVPIWTGAAAWAGVNPFAYEPPAGDTTPGVGEPTGDTTDGCNVGPTSITGPACGVTCAAAEAYGCAPAAIRLRTLESKAGPSPLGPIARMCCRTPFVGSPTLRSVLASAVVNSSCVMLPAGSARRGVREPYAAWLILP